MLYQYPYSSLYNLNLDWIIKAIKEMQEIVAPLDRVVNSVNGLTGDVEITKALLTQILGNLVETFNGRSGEIELTADDVNATLIDITWTSDPGDTISDLTQTELDELYTSGKRIMVFVNNLGVADRVYFLQYYDNHAMPQEYSPSSALAGVVSFNGQTGNVTATGADLATSATDSTTIAANLANLENTKVPNTRTINNQPLSANVNINAGDVPSQAITGATDVEMALGNLNNSKVPNLRRVNGKSLLNDITLNDEDIPSDVDGQTNVAEVISYQSQQILNLNAIMTAEQLSNPTVLISDAAIDNFQVYKIANILFFRGNIDFPNTQISAYTNILDFGITVYSMGVSALDATDNTVTFCAILNANGRLSFTKYIPASHRIYVYGSAIIR